MITKEKRETKALHTALHHAHTALATANLRARHEFNAHARRKAQIVPSAKKKITAIVRRYIRTHRRDYMIVVKGIAMQRKIIAEGLHFQAGSDQRPLYELPELLDRWLSVGLSDEESMWWKTVVGGRWFAREFSEFSLQDKI